MQSSLLAIGPTTEYQTSDSLDKNGNIAIWRVDPTGQFWRMDAGAVGRAAINIEAELVNKVRQSMKKGHQHNPAEEETEHITVSNSDVKTYLSSLSMEQALSVATDCLVNGIMSSMKRNDPNLHSNGSTAISLLDKGLRKRLKTAIIRSTPFGVTHESPVELIRG